jgi:hypothetical protein
MSLMVLMKFKNDFFYNMRIMLMLSGTIATVCLNTVGFEGCKKHL